jgi:hypothetical protein
MPITPYLDGFSFDAEAKRVMGIAFEITCVALRVKRLTRLLKQPPRGSSSLRKTASAILIDCATTHWTSCADRRRQCNDPS